MNQFTSLEAVLRAGPIVDSDGRPTRELLRWFQGLENKAPAVDLRAQITAPTKIAGRSDAIFTTVGGLDQSGRLVSGLFNNPVNVSTAPLSPSLLSNNGVQSTVVIAASTQQFDFGTVSYNSGSIATGYFGDVYVFADDPNYAGGAVVYQTSSTPPPQVAGKGRIRFGKITTVFGGAQTGGGYAGGTTPHGAGGGGYQV